MIRKGTQTMPTHDILREYFLLCLESMDYVKNQLNYYRASAYKQETADLIQREIQLLKKISSMVSRQDLYEIILDFEAEAGPSGLHQAPGECHYSNRMLRFISRFTKELEQLMEKHEGDHKHVNQRLENTILKIDLESAEGFLPGSRAGSRALDFFQKYLVHSEQKTD